jgi:hypothetical protein
MKAQRRHELQANELARQLETFPETLKRHASTIMLVIAVVLVVFFLVRYRRQAAENRAATLATSLATARQGPIVIRSLALRRLPPEQLSAMRTELIGQTQSAIDSVLREADGDDAAAMRAAALTARGDLNWYLANSPTLPGAATQQSLALPRSRDEYLRLAESDYRDVINTYASQTIAWVTAQLGLAAIAENRGEWDKARQLYSEVLTRSDIPDVFQQQAQFRIATLGDVQNPVLIGDFAPSTMPAATSNPTTAPSAAATPGPATTQSGE